MHAEPEYNFFEMFRRHFPDKTEKYGELVEQVSADFLADEQAFKEMVELRTKDRVATRNLTPAAVCAERVLAERGLSSRPKRN